MSPHPDLDPAAAWRLWSPGVAPTERIARLRALAALLSLLAGSWHPVIDLLRLAEQDEEATIAALRAIAQFPAVTQRKAMSTFLALHRPRRDQHRPARHGCPQAGRPAFRRSAP